MYDVNDLLRIIGSKEVQIIMLREVIEKQKEEVFKMAEQIRKDHGEPT
jgi:hypothetical protein